jgi:hypothetical protein
MCDLPKHREATILCHAAYLPQKAGHSLDPVVMSQESRFWTLVPVPIFWELPISMLTEPLSAKITRVLRVDVVRSRSPRPRKESHWRILFLQQAKDLRQANPPPDLINDKVLVK